MPRTPTPYTCEQCKIQFRSSNPKRFCSYSHWIAWKKAAFEGSKILDKDGYIWVKTHTHPFRNAMNYIRQHRLVMEQYLGRYLSVDEVIHHINGNKGDNRVENLELMTKHDHMSRHQKGKPKTPEHRAKLVANLINARKLRHTKKLTK